MARINEAQKECLISFMEENYNFLFGRHPTLSGNISKQRKWNEITLQLNQMGPPTKNVDNWKKVTKLMRYFKNKSEIVFFYRNGII